MDESKTIKKISKILKKRDKIQIIIFAIIMVWPLPLRKVLRKEADTTAMTVSLSEHATNVSSFSLSANSVEYRKIHVGDKCLRPVCKCIESLAAQPVLQRDEAGAEISAVDCREILRLKRAQSARVVPVAEVPAVSRKLFHRVQHAAYEALCA